jgi:hypothetical protein
MATSLLEKLVLRSGVWIDKRDWSPKSVGERAISELGTKRREAAKSDKNWTEIEDKRRRDGAGSYLFLSKDLGWPDWEEQCSVESALVPDPYWLGLAQWAREHGVAGWARRWVTRRQLARRGWSDADVWSLGRTVAKRTAEMLYAKADEGFSWPGDHYAVSIEAWQQILVEKADALAAWSEPDDRSELDAWYNAATTRGSESEATELHAALEGSMAARKVAAQEAMVWVSEHLEVLWAVGAVPVAVGGPSRLPGLRRRLSGSFSGQLGCQPLVQISARFVKALPRPPKWTAGGGGDDLSFAAGVLIGEIW